MAEVMDDQEKYADKVAKLLRKAEDTEHQEEAETFLSAAQRLMRKWGITNAMIAAKEDRPKEELIEAEIKFTGSYQKATRSLAFAIFEANNCQGFYRNEDWQKPPHQLVVICGYESDVERVQLLCSSLQLQCTSALTSWWKREKKHFQWASKGEQWRERRQFILGFSNGVRLKCDKAATEADKEVAEEQADLNDETMDDAAAGVALIVRSRKDQVKDWYDTEHGSHVRILKQRYTPGSEKSSGAGLKAGLKANTNTGANNIGVGQQHLLEA